MSTLRKFVLAVLAVAVCLSTLSFADAQTSTHAKQTSKHTKKKKETAPPIPVYTPQTLSPLPLDQVPAVPPEVTFKGGQLTIIAHNSTLGDVLRAVRKQTGAELDIPPNASDRVVTDLGPGPARDVLAQLLNGSHFNYVMLGSPSDPSQIQRVVLTSKVGPETASAAPPPGPAANPMANRFGQQPTYVPQQQQQLQPDESQPEDNPADMATDTTDDNSADQQPDDGSADQNSGQRLPKTPEQLLQELQRQQQQLNNQQGTQPGQPQIVYPNGLPNGGQSPANTPEQ